MSEQMERRTEWRVETDQTEDDFGTDEQAARDWLARCENEPDWMPAVLMSRVVTTATTPWTPATDEAAGADGRA